MTNRRVADRPTCVAPATPATPAPAALVVVLATAFGLVQLDACTATVGDQRSASRTGSTSSAGPGPTGSTTGATTGQAKGKATGQGGETGSIGSAPPAGVAGAGTGTGTASGTSGGVGTVGVAITPAIPQSFRRLTEGQFKNSLRTLLGDVTVAAVEEDSHDGGLAAIGATQIVTSPDGVEKYQTAIDAALDAVFSDPTKRTALVSGAGAVCTPKIVTNVTSAAAGDACTNAFIARFGRLAWRRSLTSAETSRYTTLATSAAQSLADPYAGARWAASALLQSPNFLYRSELGQAMPGRADLRQLTSLEMASRLAFFLWEGLPDDALLLAAEAGQLSSVDGIRQQAQRLIASPTGRNAVTGFVRDFFWLGRLDGTAKDSTLFPQFTPTLRTSMAAELTRLWEFAAFDRDGSALDLFTTRHTFVTKELGALYGLPTAGLSDTTLTAVDLPATGSRLGFLSTAALLSMNADQKEGSPTLRGKFIREELLCQTIPPPPNNVDTTLPDPPAGVVFTRREKLERHRTSPTCAACHQLMDPLGFPLESFDAIGQYRTTDAGKPIDTSGSLGAVTFDGLPGLAAALAAAPEAARCMVEHLYRYATGSALAQGEDVAVNNLVASFAGEGYRLRALLTDIVTSEGFRLLTPVQP